MANVITIDGTASSGKSTAGFLFAQKINYQFIDSGLIYRLAVILVQKNSIDITDPEGCARVLKISKIDFTTQDNKVRVLLDGEDVTTLLKTPEVDSLVSIVAAHHLVREACREIQYKITEDKNSVVAGRDIGSEVFPSAKLKFFITASVKARAQRRFNQLIKDHQEIKLEEVEGEIKRRDEVDSTRQASPMRVPYDATTIDTSDMSIDQVVGELMKYYQNAKI